MKIWKPIIIGEMVVVMHEYVCVVSLRPLNPGIKCALIQARILTENQIFWREVVLDRLSFKGISAIHDDA